MSLIKLMIISDQIATDVNIIAPKIKYISMSLMLSPFLVQVERIKLSSCTLMLMFQSCS